MTAAVLDRAEDFASGLPVGGSLLGLDLGTRTIGIAISDIRRRIATPVETLRRSKFQADATRLLDIAEKRSAVGIVLGLPRNMDGSEGPRCQATRSFARNFSQRTHLPLTFADERLSTVAAERALLAADASRARRREVIDAVAAGFILQGFLDRLANLEHENE